MKDDFTRDTFDPTKHFSRVLMQQGRVTLDADHNEQSDILLHLIRTLTRDLLGPYAAPSDEGGFRLIANGNKGLTVTAGRIYVDGILVENEEDCAYGQQPDYPLPVDDALQAEFQKPSGLSFWVYLDIWERNITWIEDDSIREKALNGANTCARSKVVWQVKALSSASLDQNSDGRIAELRNELYILQKELAQTADQAAQAALKAKIDAIQRILAQSGGTDQSPVPLTCSGPLATLTGLSRALMTAQLDPGRQIQDPCLTSPASQYRGAENQLYRVEVHTPGTAGTATFKWSRDNGSVATPWLGTSGNDLQVGLTRGFTAGAWVELSDDVLDLQGLPGVLVKLAKVDGGALSVDPATVSATAPIVWHDEMVNPRVRRWDQQSSDALQLVNGAVPVMESSSGTLDWIDLEDGIQVMFSPSGTYRTGDYWMVPARVATGQIEWPSTPDANGVPVNDALSPHGIEHHYAPLGIFALQATGAPGFTPCRCEFTPIDSCYGQGSMAVGAHLLLNALSSPDALAVQRQRTGRKSAKP